MKKIIALAALLAPLGLVSCESTTYNDLSIFAEGEIYDYGNDINEVTLYISQRIEARWADKLNVDSFELPPEISSSKQIKTIERLSDSEIVLKFETKAGQRSTLTRRMGEYNMNIKPDAYKYAKVNSSHSALGIVKCGTVTYGNMTLESGLKVYTSALQGCSGLNDFKYKKYTDFSGTVTQEGLDTSASAPEFYVGSSDETTLYFALKDGVLKSGVSTATITIPVSEMKISDTEQIIQGIADDRKLVFKYTDFMGELTPVTFMSFI